MEQTRRNQRWTEEEVNELKRCHKLYDNDYKCYKTSEILKDRSALDMVSSERHGKVKSFRNMPMILKEKYTNFDIIKEEKWEEIDFLEKIHDFSLYLFQIYQKYLDGYFKGFYFKLSCDHLKNKAQEIQQKIDKNTNPQIFSSLKTQLAITQLELEETQEAWKIYDDIQEIISSNDRYEYILTYLAINLYKKDYKAIKDEIQKHQQQYKFTYQQKEIIDILYSISVSNLTTNVFQEIQSLQEVYQKLKQYRESFSYENIQLKDYLTCIDLIELLVSDQQSDETKTELILQFIQHLQEKQYNQCIVLIQEIIQQIKDNIFIKKQTKTIQLLLYSKIFNTIFKSIDGIYFQQLSEIVEIPIDKLKQLIIRLIHLKLINCKINEEKLVIIHEVDELTQQWNQFYQNSNNILKTLQQVTFK